MSDSDKEKPDPKADEKFERVVDHFLKTLPKPRSDKKSKGKDTKDDDQA